MRKTTLGDLVTFRTGKLNSNAAVATGQYPFFTCSQETYRIDSYSFDTECVLLAGNNAAGVYPLKYYKGKFDAYQRTYVIESLDHRVLSTRFLYYLLRPQLERLQTLSTGAATKFLTLSILKNIEVSLPNVDVQRRIASILSAYDDLIENNTRRIAILEEMARRIYEEWFVRFRFPGYEQVRMVESELGLIPEGWSVEKVASVVQRLPAGQTYKKESVAESGSVMVVDQSTSDYLGFHDLDVDHPASVNAPRIIFGDHTCKLKLMLRPFSVGPNTIPFVGTGGLDSIYVFQLVQGLVQTREYKRHWTDFSDKQVVLCKKELASSYGDAVRGFFHLAQVLDDKNRTLRATRDLLLPKLISGELDVSTLPEPEEAIAA